MAPQAELLPRAERIFCNRNLRLDQIGVVGFDMDYTLAVYRQPEIDRLSITATARKLVAKGYPESLLTMGHLAHFPIRGLLVDKKLGNVLKTDRYRYVKEAYHGFERLSKEDRRRHYQDSKRVRPGTPRYHAIDTLYALSEVTVFCAAVQELERTQPSTDYAALFDEVRASIDEAHQDGAIKDQIVADPERYIARDPQLGATLHKLRSSGKKLFLLTNSSLQYTDAVMRYLLDDERSEYRSWLHYFDIVVTDAAKPGFFSGERPFLELELPGATSSGRGQLYKGGSLRAFEELTACRGDEVLYVGDHIFGDVLRAKKDSAWRTLMIIQELREELTGLDARHQDLERLQELERRHFSLLDLVRERQRYLKALNRTIDERRAVEHTFGSDLESDHLINRRALERARAQLKAVNAEYEELEDRIERALHPYWGSAFKAGAELSCLGEQVERYACLYTDRVSNLGHYSAMHYFRGPRDRMAHET